MNDGGANRWAAGCLRVRLAASTALLAGVVLAPLPALAQADSDRPAAPAAQAERKAAEGTAGTEATAPGDADAGAEGGESDADSSGASDEAESTDTGDAEASEGEAEDSGESDGEKSDAEDDSENDGKADAAPPPLDPASQSPEPVKLDDRPWPPRRLVDVGAFVGAVNRPSGSSLVTYGPTVAWGFYGRPLLTDWLAVRVYYREELIPVDVKAGGFDTARTNFGATDWKQPSLDLRTLGLRVEPIWTITPRLRAFGIVGIGWLRYVADEPSSTGEFAGVRSASRAAVELNYPLGAGVSFDAVRDWMIVSASFTYGFVSTQSGTAVDADKPLQGVDADGSLVYIAPLPKFERVTDLLLSMGIYL